MQPAVEDGEAEADAERDGEADADADLVGDAEVEVGGLDGPVHPAVLALVALITALNRVPAASSASSEYTIAPASPLQCW